MSPELWVAIVVSLLTGGVGLRILEQFFGKEKSIRDELRKDIESLRSAVKDLQRQVNGLEQEIEEWKAKVDDWRAKYYDLEKAYQRLMLETERKDIKILTLSEQLASVQLRTGGTK